MLSTKGFIHIIWWHLFYLLSTHCKVGINRETESIQSLDQEFQQAQLWSSFFQGNCSAYILGIISLWWTLHCWVPTALCSCIFWGHSVSLLWTLHCTTHIWGQSVNQPVVHIALLSEQYIFWGQSVWCTSCCQSLCPLAEALWTKPPFFLAHNDNSSFQNICQDTGQSWNFSVYVPISYLFKCLHSWTRMIFSWLVTLLE